MNEVAQSEKHAPGHPDIGLVIYQVLQVGINNLWWSVHWCRHAFNIFFDWIVVFLTDLWEIVSLFGTWSEVAQFVVFIFAKKDVLYFYVSVVVTGCVHRLES